MTEPDESQHLFGPGSPEARAALRAVDRNIGLLLQAVAARGLAGRTDVLVLSDHGFATSGTEVAVVDSLVNAGFKASRTSTDVVVDNEAQSVLLHVRGHDPAKIVRIAHYLQRRSWADVVFTAGAANSTQGDVPGTFALGVIDEQSTARGPDLMVTLPWTNDTNRYGVVGAQSIAASGPPVAEGVRGSHGGLSPYVIHNTLIAWGPDFARGAVDSAPVGNVDVAPTVLALLGRAADTVGMQGRVIREAMRGAGPVGPLVSRDTLLVSDGADYRAALRVIRVGSHRYIDAAWRTR
jgi:arylsulfatase A-like enzyme